jgi:thioredoxin-dependent peroxiredoxin
VIKKVGTNKSVSKSKPIIKANAPKFVKHKTHLKVGDMAPNFEGKEQDGNTISLHSLKGKKIILYFYPKDDTPGCTATACSLRDEQTFLRNKNYAVVGVSGDNEKSHAKFAAKYELPFPLLADANFVVAKAYGVFGKKQFMGRITEGIVRTTFVINENGVITQVIDAVDTQNHAQQVLGLENAR